TDKKTHNPKHAHHNHQQDIERRPGLAIDSERPSMNHAVETKTGLNERRSREKNRPGKVSLNREPASSRSQYGLQKIGTILNSEIERGSENASNKSDDQALAKAR